MLTAYDGQSITYDASGNPTSYYNGTRWTFTWENGRSLATASSTGKTISYAYDASGLRTSKTVNGVTHYYYYASGKLLRETYGNNILDFFYDQNGHPYAFKYNGTMYYYITNLQGDVIYVLDGSGATVASYKYDPYGNIVSGGTTTVGAINPLRYRGYYYDTDTGLYYLQSRYYDPAIGRFINADVYASTGQGALGFNMFAYCRNNPVKRKDVTGTSDILYTDGDDDNPLDDLGYPGGGGGGGFGGGYGGTSGSCTGYAYAYNPIDAGYSYHVSFDVAMYSSLYTGGIYQVGYDTFEVYSNPTSTSSTSTSTTPSACFVAGTLVQSEDGAVAIEDVAVGDMVWAWDETTGDVALKEVVETYINQSDELIHVFVNGEEIITTPTHPFYSPVKGWTAAAKLRAGDILVLVNGEYVVVEKVQHEILEAPITVYNFQVEGYHTYYVSDVGVLVHNMCAYKPLRDGVMRATINPGELEPPHAHIFEKANNIGRVFANGEMDPSLIGNRNGMRFVKEHYNEIIALIGEFYGKR